MTAVLFLPWHVSSGHLLEEVVKCFIWWSFHKAVKFIFFVVVPFICWGFSFSFFFFFKFCLFSDLASLHHFMFNLWLVFIMTASSKSYAPELACKISWIALGLCDRDLPVPFFNAKPGCKFPLAAVVSNSLLGMVLCLASLTVIPLPLVTFHCQST